tara:strand:- start:566 stop:748 length:183 start_codon:yes stop_codon:yes gene_type:complete
MDHCKNITDKNTAEWERCQKDVEKGRANGAKFISVKEQGKSFLWSPSDKSIYRRGNNEAG